MYALIRGLLFLLSAETAHHLVLTCLAWASRLTSVCAWKARRAFQKVGMAPVKLAGLSFPHPIGLAAGLDKDARAVPAFWALGFSFVEVGTITPRPQPGNPKPRLFRLPEHQALINRMGFNNQGADQAAHQLERLKFRPGPVGANLGKNKDTPLEQAPQDYARCTELLAPHSDYLVVNLSSPNTPGLRTLQEPTQLRAVLQAVAAAQSRIGTQRPVFLKIAPDLEAEAIESAVDVAVGCGLSGLIATNTTLQRPVKHALANEAGGLSGRPLAPLATGAIQVAYRHAAGRLPIIGVGGIFTPEDAYRKIRAGACLLQIYTGFIYEGPGLISRLCQGIQELARKDGYASWEQAVGADSQARENVRHAGTPHG